jgi:hypothetical protein
MFQLFYFLLSYYYIFKFIAIIVLNSAKNSLSIPGPMGSLVFYSSSSSSSSILCTKKDIFLNILFYLNKKKIIFRIFGIASRKITKANIFLKKYLIFLGLLFLFFFFFILE